MSRIECSKILHTCGDGLWSRTKTAVRITGLFVRRITDDFGELRVFFDEDDWSVDEHGLIYTDRLFEKELRKFLQSMNLESDGVSYSEQGMQGYDYVSLDVDGKFMQSFNEHVGPVESY